MKPSPAFLPAVPIAFNLPCPKYATSLRTAPSACAPPPLTRRTLLSTTALAVASLVLPAPSSAAMYSSDTVSNARYAAAVTDPKAKLSDLMPQILDGRDTLVTLQRDWGDKTSTLDGDVVRRVLGTVGLTSPLFNIKKAYLKAWKIIAESGEVDEEQIDRLETSWNAILDGISSIDFQTYSISFTELLESKTSLAEKAKIALDSTVESYNDFINDIPKSLL